MYQRALSLLLIFSLAFNIAFAGIWLYNRNRPASPPERATPAVGRQANAPWAGMRLGPQQQSRLAEVRRRQNQEAAELTAQVREERVRLLQLMEADNPDQEAIRASLQRIEQGQARLREMTVNQIRALGELLTPEQRRMLLQRMRGQGEGAGRRRGGPRLRGQEGRPNGLGPRTAPGGGPPDQNRPEGG